MAKYLPAHSFREHGYALWIQLSDFQEKICFGFSVQIKNL